MLAAAEAVRAMDIANPIAQRTSPAMALDDSQGTSPAPTNRPILRFRNAHVARQQNTITCGYLFDQRLLYPWLAIGCSGSCRTQGGYIGCETSVATACYPGTASAMCAQGGSAGARDLCCKHRRMDTTMFDDDNDERQRAPISNAALWQHVLRRIQHVKPLHAAAPVGAIVGGIIGGVAVIALTAGVIAWLVLRRRKEARNASGGGPHQPPNGPQPIQPYVPTSQGLPPTARAQPLPPKGGASPGIYEVPRHQPTLQAHNPAPPMAMYAAPAVVEAAGTQELGGGASPPPIYEAPAVNVIGTRNNPAQMG
ncbi:hypothetical protein CPLU01_11644 [Colletotrichum plurivorum]|uniref:Uncharacterized protein n=1 Tax=Colletotrichum plurivorum TaxID=2175906 RepID=A0A8H6K219_9PEZI|nr:hypothetical protein CPLU01_11644 [Colletotrichum plurivorum]